MMSYFLIRANCTSKVTGTISNLLITLYAARYVILLEIDVMCRGTRNMGRNARRILISHTEIILPQQMRTTEFM